MSKLIFDQSTSLDGYSTGPNPRAEEPNGDGGLRLVDWMLAGAPEDQAPVAETHENTRALLCGRNTYDVSLPFWGPNGPSGERRLPMVVLTHEPPAETPENGVYEFASGGIEAALDRARELAGGGDVAIVGGADVARQYLRAGLLDEILLHVVPVFLGAGTRLFEDGDGPIEFEQFALTQTEAATHLRLRRI